MKIAVALHLFNVSILTEFKEALANITQPYDLFITVPDDGITVQEAFPLARLYRHQPNRGMDIGGFFTVLPEILTGDYEVVLKLHSKTDVRWRQILIQATCGTQEQVAKCLTLLQQPHIGAVGATKLLFKDGQGGYWKRNQLHIQHLAQHFKMSLQPVNFIGGTMFWMKLAPLRKIFREFNLAQVVESLNTPETFDWAWYQSFYQDLRHLTSKDRATQHWKEHGQQEGRAPNALAARMRGLQERTDGMIEHAYERFFGLLLVNQGLIVKGVSLPGEAEAPLRKKATTNLRLR
jgi:lipopolysaccharide biosynthesis protein